VSYVEKNDKQYFEDCAPHIQEVIIELFASIIENKQNKEPEEKSK